jgi:hypothetical protein
MLSFHTNLGPLCPIPYGTAKPPSLSGLACQAQTNVDQPSDRTETALYKPHHPQTSKPSHSHPTAKAPSSAPQMQQLECLKTKEVTEFGRGKQLPSPLSIKRSSFEDPTISHHSPTSNRKRSRSLSDYAELSYENLTHKRAKCRGTNTSLQDKNSGKIFVEERVSVTRKQQDESGGNRKRHQRQFSAKVPGSVASWLESLPASSQELEDMSQPLPQKRARSQSSSSERSLHSDTGNESTTSRGAKHSIYQDARYPTILESKSSFMRDSEQGPLPEELSYCKGLLTGTHPVPEDPLFEGQLLSRFLTLLQDRSELRICIDLHPRLVPSPELLSLQGAHGLGNLIEGHNDRWNKAIVFYKQLPQPDRAVAYRDRVLTDQQRRKLRIVPEVSSLYTAREGTCFPFFTCEVKCGKQALDIADRANTNSMTIALRGVVELYRRAECVMDIHRRFLGFSISHDDRNVRIYGHYPEIDGENTSYYRYRIREFSCGDKDGEERWTPYTFVYNLYTQFAPMHIERIKKVVDLLPEPLLQSFNSASLLDDQTESDSQAALSTPMTPQTSQQEIEFIKPGAPKGRVTIAQLKQQLEQQGAEARAHEERLVALLEQREATLTAQLEQREATLTAQLEQQREEVKQQREEVKQREATLTAQLEQREATLTAQLEQREATLTAQLEQQHQESEQQRKELMQLLSQQSNQISQQSNQIKQLLDRTATEKD